MTILKKGTEVRVNNTYLAAQDNVDDSVLKTRGATGVVTGYVGSFLEVTPSNPDKTFWDKPFLFWPEELDVLEVAHPIQKELIKS